MHGQPCFQALNQALAHAFQCNPRHVLNLTKNPLSFVPQANLPGAEAYEAFIYRTSQVPTRNGLHDFFNGLCWLHYPRTKRRLNALQAQQILQSGIGSVRGSARDGLTVLDENAAFLQAPDALWQALLAKDWQKVFGSLQPLWAQSQLLLFGHALVEKLCDPRKNMTAHVYRVGTQATSLTAIDEWMAADLSAERLAAKPFAHLPVLGVPGWWPANQDPIFYADSKVFRAPKGVEKP